MQRILVTGATGGLGRNAVEYLLSRHISVRATGRNSRVGDALRRQGVDFQPLDLSTASLDDIARLVDGMDAVWHCAALSSPWGAHQDFLAINVTATSRLANAAGQQQVPRFVHISTPATYFDFCNRYDVAETFQAARYVNSYAATKALAEQAVQREARCFNATHFTILRPRAIFGPHDQVLLPRLLRVLHSHGGTLPLPRGGRTLLDLTYVGNVVHAMWQASTVKGYASGEAFNITNHEPAELGAVLRQLFAQAAIPQAKITAAPYLVLAAAARGLECLSKLTGQEPALTAYGVGALHFDMTLSNEKAIRGLHYRPPVPLREGIRRTAAWLREGHA